MLSEIRGRDKFNKYKAIINILIKIDSYLPKSINKKLYVFFINTKGLVGLGIRYILLRNLAKNCGQNVSIHSQVYIYEIDKISFGSNVSIHPMCYLDGTGEIEIGNDVSIAHGVTIMSTDHIYNNLFIPIKDQGVRPSKVIINSNVWIGAKATILSGTTISNGSIVAAAAVVTKDVPQNSIVAGIPAKVIKKRG
jgi:acetyltransferase-like isoleucine patch superfamily enzyme